MKGHSRQLGIALVTVLLILAIASVAVVSMSGSRQLDIRRTENLMRSGQAWEYLYSLESWAGDILRQDGAGHVSDRFADGWYRPLPKTAIPGGVLQAGLSDLQGRFNLNNLLIDGKTSDRDVKRFRRLLALLQIKAEVADAVLDWIDADSEIRYPGGAEDETYLRRNPPYRSANGLFADVSELLLVAGIKQDDYRKLRSFIYTAATYAPLNVNTADRLLLRTLAEDLTERDAESLIRARKAMPFQKIEDFLKADVISDLAIAKEGLAVASQQFLLSGTVRIGANELWFESQLQRNRDGRATVVKRMRRHPHDG